MSELRKVWMNYYLPGGTICTQITVNQYGQPVYPDENQKSSTGNSADISDALPDLRNPGQSFNAPKPPKTKR